MSPNRFFLPALTAIAGGVAWIPMRLGVSVAFSTEFLRLDYVTWNKLMVVPLALMIAAGVALATSVGSRAARIGAAMAVAGLIGMLAGVVVEFFVFGGLSGDRGGAMLGWGIYLLGGLLVHVIGLAVLAVARWGTAVGWLALLIAALHVAWLPSGFVEGGMLLVADQVAIGLAWVALGVAAGRRPLAA
jgi:hypothetical protein